MTAQSRIHSVLMKLADVGARMDDDRLVWFLQPLLERLEVSESEAWKWLDWDEVIHVAGPWGRIYVITEPGLYRVLMLSNAELGREFKGVTAAALANLHEHGTVEKPATTVRGVPVMRQADGTLRPAHEAPAVKARMDAHLRGLLPQVFGEPT